MALTGPPDAAPLGPPAYLVDGLLAISHRFSDATARTARRLDVDPLGLLAERAALVGLSRGGRISCGRGTRLLATRDGWLALSLARPSDVELMPAWLGLDPVPADLARPATTPAKAATWHVVAEQVRRRPTAELERAGGELGLAVAALPSDRRAHTPPPRPFLGLPLQAEPLGAAPARSLAGLTVVDLSSLWAGPLCGRLLADAGARVLKVESMSRPDGAREGPAAFFDLMNAGKASVAVELSSHAGRTELAALVAQADVVIESSRPRALEQLGIDAASTITSGPAVWVSITGHGRTGAGRDRVAFGDDAAIAGGLASWGPQQDDGPIGPFFCADAVADPCSGLVAAAAVVTAVAAGGRWLVDVAMASVAASLAGPTVDVGDLDAAAPPRPQPRGEAPALGADTDRVLATVVGGRDRGAGR
jgi:CoA-transferase family III